MLWVLMRTVSWEGPFEHAKHMFRLQGNKIIKILHIHFCLTESMATCDFQQCGILTSVDSEKPVQTHKLINSKCGSLNSLTLIE